MCPRTNHLFAYGPPPWPRKCRYTAGVKRGRSKHGYKTSISARGRWGEGRLGPWACAPSAWQRPTPGLPGSSRGRRRQATPLFWRAACIPASSSPVSPFFLALSPGAPRAHRMLLSTPGPTSVSYAFLTFALPSPSWRQASCRMRRRRASASRRRSRASASPGRIAGGSRSMPASTCATR